MKKANNPLNLIITIMIVSALILGLMLGIIYKSNHNNKVYINPTVTVRDSTDLKQLKEYIQSDHKYLVSESIEKIISKEFDRTISYLNFSIVLFAVFLTLILVVFGFFTVNKMAEAKELLNEIRNAPEKMMKKYYLNQLNDIIPNLSSSSSTIKQDTINKLYSNTELDYKKHFELLANFLKQEFDNITSYTTINVIGLFDILCRLNYSKTIDLGYEIFEKHFNNKSMNTIIPIMLESKEKKHIEKFLSYLSDTSNPHRTNKLIENVENFDIYNSETLNYIVQNSPENIVFRILNEVVRKRKGQIDLVPLLEKFDENLFTHIHFTQILNLLRQNEELNDKVIHNVLNKTINYSLSTNHSLSTEQVLNIIRSFNSYVYEDKEIKNLILLLKEKLYESIDFKIIYDSIKKENQTRVHSAIEEVEKNN